MRAVRHIALAMPLLRLLAINCDPGIAVALLALLLALNAQLRGLIFNDRLSGAALTLRPAGFIVTFASAMMGSASMRLG
jgi:hypothetical protein